MYHFWGDFLNLRWRACGQIASRWPKSVGLLNTIVLATSDIRYNSGAPANGAIFATFTDKEVQIAVQTLEVSE